MHIPSLYIFQPRYKHGRAVAQAVSRRPSTAAARVRPCGICGGKSGTRRGFLRILRFPLPSILSTAPHSLSFIIWPGTIDHLVASVIVGSVPHHPKGKKINSLVLSAYSTHLNLWNITILSTHSGE
jgi:hypothetical protein